MTRTYSYLSAVLSVAGMLLLVGMANAQPAGGPPPAGGAPAATPTPTRPTIAVFNMAAVMREFNYVKYQMWLLNNKKNDLSKNLVILRSEYLQIQKLLTENPNHPEKEIKKERMLTLSYDIDKEDRRVAQELNNAASAIITDLYTKIKLVVDKTAEMNGYHLVFAYPDAVTEEEKKNSYIHELKLKPSAAVPFYVASHADMTAVVVKTLNTWYPAVDAQGKPVNVNELKYTDEKGQATPPPGSGPGPGPGPAPGPGPGPLPPGTGRP